MEASHGKIVLFCQIDVRFTIGFSRVSIVGYDTLAGLYGFFSGFQTFLFCTECVSVDCLIRTEVPFSNGGFTRGRTTNKNDDFFLLKENGIKE